MPPLRVYHAPFSLLEDNALMNGSLGDLLNGQAVNDSTVREAQTHYDTLRPMLGGVNIDYLYGNLGVVNGTQYLQDYRRSTALPLLQQSPYNHLLPTTSNLAPTLNALDSFGQPQTAQNVGIAINVTSCDNVANQTAPLQQITSMNLNPPIQGARKAPSSSMLPPPIKIGFQNQNLGPLPTPSPLQLASPAVLMPPVYGSRLPQPTSTPAPGPAFYPPQPTQYQPQEMSLPASSTFGGIQSLATSSTFGGMPSLSASSTFGGVPSQSSGLNSQMASPAVPDHGLPSGYVATEQTAGSSLPYPADGMVQVVESHVLHEHPSTSAQGWPVMEELVGTSMKPPAQEALVRKRKRSDESKPTPKAPSVTTQKLTVDVSASGPSPLRSSPLSAQESMGGADAPLVQARRRKSDMGQMEVLISVKPPRLGSAAPTVPSSDMSSSSVVSSVSAPVQSGVTSTSTQDEGSPVPLDAHPIQYTDHSTAHLKGASGADVPQAFTTEMQGQALRAMMLEEHAGSEEAVKQPPTKKRKLEKAARKAERSGAPPNINWMGMYSRWVSFFLWVSDVVRKAPIACQIPKLSSPFPDPPALQPFHTIPLACPTPAAVKKCADLIYSIIAAEDSLNEPRSSVFDGGDINPFNVSSSSTPGASTPQQQQQQQPYFDTDDSSLLTLDTLRLLSKHLVRIVDARKLGQLVSSSSGCSFMQEGTPDTGAAPSSVSSSSVEIDDLWRIIKLCEARMKDVEYFDLGILKDLGGANNATSAASSPTKQGSRKRKRGKGKSVSIAEGDYGDAQDRALSQSPGLVRDGDDVCNDGFWDAEHGDGSNKSVEARLLKAMERMFAGLEASFVVMLVMCGGFGRGGMNDLAATVAGGGAGVSGGARLPKRFMAEDLITSALNLIKTHLTLFVYAVLELTAKMGDELTLQVKQRRAIFERPQIKKNIVLFVAKLCDLLAKVFEVMDAQNLSDDITISVSFVALSPFFIETSSLANVIGLDKIQFQCMNILRTVFAKNRKHHSFILEEILTNLIKLPTTSKKALRQYKLPDGKSIQMVTALVLQLIQSCCSEDSLVDSCREIRDGLLALQTSSTSSSPNKKGKETNNQVKHGEGGGANTTEEEGQHGKAPDNKSGKKKRRRSSVGGAGGITEESEEKEMEARNAEAQLYERFAQVCKSGTDAASQCTVHFFRFLLSRSGSLPGKDGTFGAAAGDPQVAGILAAESGKRSRGGGATTETEYRAVLENFLKDVLAVLNEPEWPGAELICMIYSRMMIQYVDDPRKGDAHLKSMAIEWLGEISGKIRRRTPAISKGSEQALRRLEFEVLPKSEIFQGAGDQQLKQNLGTDAKTFRKDVSPKKEEKEDVSRVLSMDEKCAYLWSVQKSVIEWLTKSRQDDPGNDIAKHFFVSAWGYSLGSAAASSNRKYSGALRDIVKNMILEYCDVIISDARGPYLSIPESVASDSMFGPLSHPLLSPLDTRPTIHHLVEILATRQALYQSVGTFLSRISAALDSEFVNVRTRALKALQEVIASDPKVVLLGSKTELDADEFGFGSGVGNVNIQKALAMKLHDTSTSVRDAAVEVVSKIILGTTGGVVLSTALRNELIKEYFPTLNQRILDVGISVRKRIIKLFKEIYVHRAERLIDAHASPDLGGAPTNTNGVTGGESTVTADQEDRNLLVDISVKFLGRLTDEEDTVKELALKALQEIWFSPFKHLSYSSSSSSAGVVEGLIENALAGGSAEWQSLSAAAQREVRHRAFLMMDAVSFNNAAAERFGELLTRLFFDGPRGSAGSGGAAGTASNSSANSWGPVTKAAKHTTATVSRAVVGCLVDQILNLEDKGHKEAIKNCFTLLHQFSQAFPALLAPHIGTLQPYLKGGASFDSPPKAQQKAEITLDQHIIRLVVSILQLAVPVARDPDHEVLKEIENDLTLLLGRCLMPTLAVVAPCLCEIVSKVTKNWSKLTTVLRRCYDLVLRCRDHIKKLGQADSNLPMIMLRSCWRSLHIITHIVRIVHFDDFRETLTDQPAADLDAISKTSITSAVMEVVLFFASEVNVGNTKSIAISALGHLFIGHPRLMLRDDSRALMDTILSSPKKQSGESTSSVVANAPASEIPMKYELIRVFVEFLQNEQKRIFNKDAEKQNNEGDQINIKVLIGNADEMGDAGISSALMQIYLDRILDCMVHPTEKTLAATAFEAVSIILEQGLVHPMLCIPHLVAMETNPDVNLRDRAFTLHSKLHDKYTSFIHGRNVECVKQAYEFQRNLIAAKAATSTVQGFTIRRERRDNDTMVEFPDALLSRMYTLIQTKRPRRNEFLMNLVKIFDVDLKWKGHESVASIPLCRFVADNLATFEYKMQEEVLHVVYHCYRILSVTGETCIGQIESWERGAAVEKEGMTLSFIARTSVCMGILVLLKTHLQTLYGISDTANERPASKNVNAPTILSWERMPYVEKPLETEEDMWEQCRQFQQLMSEDYVSGFEDKESDDSVGQAEDELVADDPSSEGQVVTGVAVGGLDDESEQQRAAVPGANSQESSNIPAANRRKSAPGGTMGRSETPNSAKKKRRFFGQIGDIPPLDAVNGGVNCNHGGEMSKGKRKARDDQGDRSKRRRCEDEATDLNAAYAPGDEMPVPLRSSHTETINNKEQSYAAVSDSWLGVPVLEQTVGDAVGPTTEGDPADSNDTMQPGPESDEVHFRHFAVEVIWARVPDDGGDLVEAWDHMASLLRSGAAASSRIHEPQQGSERLEVKLIFKAAGNCLSIVDPSTNAVLVESTLDLGWSKKGRQNPFGKKETQMTWLEALGIASLRGFCRNQAFLSATVTKTFEIVLNLSINVYLTDAAFDASESSTTTNLCFELYHLIRTAYPQTTSDVGSEDHSFIVDLQNLSRAQFVPAKYPITDTNNHLQPSALNPHLLPYQRRALGWMLEREGCTLDPQGRAVPKPEDADQLPLLWEKIVTDPQNTLYVCRLTGAIATQPFPSDWGDADMRGGILAEEMGLGKTVELLALILKHPMEVIEAPALDGSVVSNQTSSEATWLCPLCGAGETDEDGKERGFQIQCDQCQEAKRLEFFVCDRCKVKANPSKQENDLTESGATLIIAPISILHQWVSEIARHTPSLRCFIYNGIKHHPTLTPAMLASKFDVVLTTYDVLTKEVHHARPPPDRKLRREKKYEWQPSPLVRILWWRVCLDEAQMVESTVRQSAEMARRIPRVNAWSVTGTPMGKNGISDLYGLMCFLHIHSFENHQMWERLTQEPYLRRTFLKVLRQLMHRNTKHAVESELSLPPQSNHLYQLKFSRVEQHYYDLLWERCTEELEALASGSNGRRLDAVRPESLISHADEREAMSKLMKSWLLRLRQTCCHPQVGSHNRDDLGKEFKSMSEVLQTLYRQCSAYILSMERTLFLSNISRAQIFEVQKDFEHALAIYSNLLKEVRQRIVFIKEDLARVRSQRAPGTDNNEDNVRQDHRDSDLDDSEKDEEDDDEEIGGGGLDGDCSGNSEDRQFEFALVTGLGSWRELEHRLLFFIASCHHSLKHTEEETRFYKMAHDIRVDILHPYKQRVERRLRWFAKFMEQMEGPMRQGPSGKKMDLVNAMMMPDDEFQKGGLFAFHIFEQIDEVVGLINGQWVEMEQWRQVIIKALLSKLDDEEVAEEGGDPTGEEYREGLEIQEKGFLFQELYDKALLDRKELLTGFRVTERRFDPPNGGADESEDVAELEELRQSFMLPTGMPHLKALISNLRQLEQRHNMPEQEITLCRMAAKALNKECERQINKLTLLERESRVFNRLYNSRIEYYRQLQKLSDNVTLPEMPHDLERMKADILQEEQALEIRIVQQVGRRRYLTNLMKEDEEATVAGQIDRDCGICKLEVEKGALTPCGHVFCEVQTQVTRVSFKLIRQEQHSTSDPSSSSSSGSSGPSPAPAPPTSEDSSLSTLAKIGIKGSFGTKLDTVIKQLKHLRSKDPSIKALVFSQWEQVLDILGKGLEKNNIGYVKLEGKGGARGGGRVSAGAGKAWGRGGRAEAVIRFRDDPEICVFMLNAKSQSQVSAFP
ncbi:hypothetical protein HK102_004409 [Quaeritorhiza haematococci]|nr:hypothetical protein HK102_004409 [Quaeritorhiza haematococci]